MDESKQHKWLNYQKNVAEEAEIVWLKGEKTTQISSKRNKCCWRG
jgi:hypothetical protein